MGSNSCCLVAKISHCTPARATSVQLWGKISAFTQSRQFAGYVKQFLDQSIGQIRRRGQGGLCGSAGSYRGRCRRGPDPPLSSFVRWRREEDCLCSSPGPFGGSFQPTMAHELCPHPGPIFGQLIPVSGILTFAQMQNCTNNYSCKFDTLMPSWLKHFCYHHQ